ncbi:MAG: hypothetical protein LLG05_07830 [Porphyromonadaceae bacterium]|nr:hypothetical protein [Porphyromonadaceae bacterium]
MKKPKIPFKCPHGNFSCLYVDTCGMGVEKSCELSSTERNLINTEVQQAMIEWQIKRQKAEDSDVQVVDEKIEFSWFPNNGNCSGVFSSIEGAIKDAEKAYKNGDIEFDNDIEPIINIGPIRRFNLKEAVKNIAEGIEDNIYEQVHDFAFGCDIEVEADISKKDKDSFISEASNVLFPIIEKYMVVNPSFVCTPEMTYNLKTTVWLFLKKKAEEEKK